LPCKRSRYPEIVRLALIAAALFLVSCGSPSVPPPPQDATAAPWYAETIAQLTEITSTADQFFHKGKPDDAALLIEKGEPLASRLLAVPHPTLAATAAASDLDDLYGRMLLSNKHYGWARLLFQKNLARWKYWKPPDPQATRRLAQAEAAIAECDRRMAQ
jgi:hypothetical protein